MMNHTSVTSLAELYETIQRTVEQLRTNKGFVTSEDAFVYGSVFGSTQNSKKLCEEMSSLSMEEPRAVSFVQQALKLSGCDINIGDEAIGGEMLDLSSSLSDLYLASAYLSSLDIEMEPHIKVVKLLTKLADDDGMFSDFTEDDNELNKIHPTITVWRIFAIFIKKMNRKRMEEQRKILHSSVITVIKKLPKLPYREAAEVIIFLAEMHEINFFKLKEFLPYVHALIENLIFVAQNPMSKALEVGYAYAAIQRAANWPLVSLVVDMTEKSTVSACSILGKPTKALKTLTLLSSPSSSNEPIVFKNSTKTCTHAINVTSDEKLIKQNPLLVFEIKIKDPQSDFSTESTIKSKIKTKWVMKLSHLELVVTDPPSKIYSLSDGKEMSGVLDDSKTITVSAMVQDSVFNTLTVPGQASLLIELEKPDGVIPGGLNLSNQVYLKADEQGLLSLTLPLKKQAAIIPVNGKYKFSLIIGDINADNHILKPMGSVFMKFAIKAKTVKTANDREVLSAVSSFYPAPIITHTFPEDTLSNAPLSAIFVFLVLTVSGLFLLQNHLKSFNLNYFWRLSKISQIFFIIFQALVVAISLSLFIFWLYLTIFQFLTVLTVLTIPVAVTGSRVLGDLKTVSYVQSPITDEKKD
eukprot:GHVL01036964.1.p1 GENE.GHVL01036964.1~~GHVL01036964.1.p1  ORF type:complete len:637 (+),score=114.97 GHVL01036964.1:428-2338(+)